MSTTRIYVMMVFTALFWSGAFITGKLAIREFPAFSLTFFRFLFALPFIFAVLYWKERPHFFPNRKAWPSLILLGVMCTFLYHALFFSALQYTTAMNASLLGATNPMVTALLACLFFREKLGLLQVTGIVLSFSGVVLIVTDGGALFTSGLEVNPGDFLMFAAVSSWAVYALVSRKVMLLYKLSPLMMTAYTFLVCTIFAIPFVGWENPAVYWQGITFGGWLSVLYMAVFASVLGYLFQMMAIQQIGAPRTAIFMNLVPVFTVIQSMLILGESFSLLKAVSTFLILIGVYFATRPAKDSMPILVAVNSKNVR
ncbi:drug/metabolite transporter (DMT)-like permease [Sporomusaceae bacterium BoRhaA]|uniref:DMT family transporter n=1 Tax=Pelorhabdus rhamnosifermentans TaxID=2772457 RepID=UPI001C05F698|nr:DMT family transporter [Pelorhabdus rhamnosifermentans]MBU2702220.1 drug/metabolite transporter (DMT)-like permease [Pelorhabdus rhamnosifermentans]